jgi:hypothetical protein
MEESKCDTVLPDSTMKEAAVDGSAISNTMAMSSTSSEKKEEKEEVLCPLFMDGLPSDFSTNPHLAAIASLLGSDNDDDDDAKSAEAKTILPQKLSPAPGGGKRAGTQSRAQRKAQPYPSQKAKNQKKTPGMGEAELFLKMWKL